MTGVTLYDASVRIYIQAVDVLLHLITKLKEHAGSNDNVDSYVSARLAPDMLPLSFQVQVVSNTSKKALERLAPHKGPYPVWEDNETTIAQLVNRLEETLQVLKKIKPEDLEGREKEVVEVKLGPRGTATAEGKGYALGYALPNVFFHVMAVYAILRKEGVPIGKTDYLQFFLSPNLLTQPTTS